MEVTGNDVSRQDGKNPQGTKMSSVLQGVSAYSCSVGQHFKDDHPESLKNSQLWDVIHLSM